MAEQREIHQTGNVTAIVQRKGPVEKTTFSRMELNTLLQAYGAGVAAGEWRDYAIDFLPEVAIFSIFRFTADRPHYTVEKRPKLAQRQGAFAVRDLRGSVLRRGHDLARVLMCLSPIRRLK